MANIKDVAREANVSVTTVSRVLNNRGYISEETRKVVNDAMTRLHYQPNEVARSLLKKESHMIGLIIPSVSHPFFSKLTRYVEFYADKLGYKIVLCDSLMEPEKEKDYIEMLKRHLVDGIIMGSHTLEVKDYVEVNLPIVSFDRKIADNIPFVTSDNYSGGMMAAKHLLDKGCARLAHISGNLLLNVFANKRNDGFTDVCNKAHAEYYIYETDINVLGHNEYGNVIEKMFKEHPDIDGVFASSDIIAADVLRYCTETGRKIPEDVKIIGYDGTDIARYVVPGITTVSQPIETMAKYAVEYLVKQIEEEMVPNETVLPVALKVRGTT